MLNSVLLWVSSWAALLGSAAGYQARLETRQDGDLLTIIGHCRNETAQPAGLHYELLTDKKGQSGTSRNQQSGAFTSVPQQDQVLSQTTINVAASDYYLVRLRLLNAQGAVVAEDSIVHQPVGKSY